MVRRSTSGGRLTFTSESDVRACVAAIRSKFATLDAAEDSPEWKLLRPAVARWIANHGKAPPGDDGWSSRVARIYLRSPHLLTHLAPTEPLTGFGSDQSQ